MDPPLDRELELRAHIRSLLLQYALTHLATNYVTWTQEAVTDLLSESLRFAPIRAPTEVTLPVDPFQQLCQSWNLSKLDLYEERWKVGSADVLSYLKGQIAVPPGIEISENLWTSDSDEDFDTFLLSRPMSPILTTHSRRETPLFSKGTNTARLPRGNGEMLKTWRIHPAEEVAFDEANVNVDDVLGNKLEIDTESHWAVVDLIKSVPTMSARSGEISATRNFDEFLRTNTPPQEVIEPQELPIFPRTRRPGRALSSPGSGRTHLVTSLKAMSNAPCPLLSKVEVKDEDDEDIANEHLKLVGGWGGIKTPSSPFTLGTPSLIDASSDIDDLVLPSSPTGGLEEEFSLMEEFQLPKTQRFRGRYSKPPRLGEGQSLSSFIAPLMHLSQAPVSRTIRSSKSRTPSPRTHISMSMLGQPPSEMTGPPALDEHPISLSARGNEILSSDDLITFAAKVVERACGGSLDDDDPYGLILAEKIDEKDEYLMDVPILPPPNEHDVSTCLPTRLTDLVASASTVSHGSVLSAHLGRYTGFLEKVKGLRSLQLELSWIPFKYGRTVPTDEEVADVADDISAQLVKAIELPQEDVVSLLSELLNDKSAFSGDSQLSSTIMTPSALVWSLDDELDLSIYTSHDDDLGLVLTRSDRLRLSGLSHLVDPNPNEDTIGHDDVDMSDGIPSPSERPTKRVRFQDIDDLEDAARVAFEEVIDKSAYTADDSGVFFASSKLHVDSEICANSFMQRAYDAEGFDGPATDGNLFLDVDLIHYDRYDRDLFSDPLPETSGFPIMSYSYNHAFAPASLDQSHLAADKPSPRDYPCDFRPSSPAPPESIPLASETNVAPGAVSCISLEPSQDPAPEAMVNEAETPAPCVSSTATAMPVISVRQYLAEYLTLCGKTSALRPYVSAPPPTAARDTHDSRTTIPDAPAAPSSGPRGAPPELFDDRTLVLPDHYTRPATEHRYMASLSLVQKRALVRELASCCAVELVERERLGDSSARPGAMSDSEDLILDCDTAVVFVPLELLPARGAGLVALLTRLSWRYAHLLVIFGCYPSAWDYLGDATKTGEDRPVASVWSPPVMKAVRNLKRDLAIAEGLQTKCEACVVGYAFTISPKEAAIFTRMYGDSAEARDTTRGDLWGERLWLTYEEHDGEYDLCGVNGMNLFSSCLLLSQVSLEGFLEKSPEDRLLEYGTLVGVDRIMRFNAEMARRLDAMKLPPSSPIDTSSSLHSVPVFDDIEMDGLL